MIFSVMSVCAIVCLLELGLQCNSAVIYSVFIFGHLSNYEQRNYRNFINSLNYGTFDPRNG